MPPLIPMGPLDWLENPAGQWLHDTAQSMTGWLMEKNEWLRQLLSKNLDQPSFSLLEQEWYNDLFSEIYGWLIIVAFAVPTIIGIVVIVRSKPSRRAANMANDIFGVAGYAIIVTLGLSVLIWIFNFAHRALTRLTGSDTLSWLTTLTPPIESMALQGTYTIELGLGTLLILANQYFVPLFVVLGLIAWAFRSWGTHRTQLFFNRVMAFGVASLFTKLIYTTVLALGNKLAEGKGVGGQGVIGFFTLAVAFGLCVFAFVGGAIVVTKQLDGRSEIEGRVVAETDDQLSVEGDVNVDMASLFSTIATTPTAQANDQRLAASQGGLAGSALAGMAADSGMLQSLMNMDQVKTANAILDRVPDELITAAGAAAGVPQAGAINAVRRDLVARADQANPS